jgi:hypothetical protein
MDPWLENPLYFPNLHHLLISATNRQLKAQLHPRGYAVSIGERIWVTTPGRSMYPDLTIVERPSRGKPAAGSVAVLDADEPVRIKSFPTEVREPYLDIVDSSGRLVTAIEILSPTNKANTKGRTLYRKKQREVLRSPASLVEIDLLRHGRHIIAVAEHRLDPAWNASYLACVTRKGEDDEFELYPIGLRSPLPRIRIPLKPGEADCVLNLQTAFSTAYDEGPFADRIDYSEPPFGGLSDDDAGWFRGFVK